MMFMARTGLAEEHIALVMGVDVNTVATYTAHASRLEVVPPEAREAARRSAQLTEAEFAQACQQRQPLGCVADWRTQLQNLRGLLKLSMVEFNQMPPAVLTLALAGLAFVKQEVPIDRMATILAEHRERHTARGSALHELMVAYDRHDLPDRLQGAVAEQLCSREDVETAEAWLAARGSTDEHAAETLRLELGEA